MRFKDRARDKSQQQPGGRPPAGGEQRPHPAGETFLDSSCELEGELRFSEDVRIDGKVKGRIIAQKAVVIGEAAVIEASIEAETLEIFGVVEGDVQVARGTTLHECARVSGEIQTAGIVVAEGAKFKGCIVIGADEPDISRAEATEIPVSTPAQAQISESKSTGSKAAA